MEYSSGTKSLFAQVASWAVVAGLAAAVFTNYSAFKHLAQVSLGLSGGPAAAEMDNRPVIQTVTPGSDSTVELRANANGHYQARADINGRDIPVMVDTGATLVVLTYDDARSAGIYLKTADFTQPVSTANGQSYVAPVVLDRVSIGGITVRNVHAAVADKGLLKTTLLGMSFLSRLQRVDMRDGTMMLKD